MTRNKSQSRKTGKTVRMPATKFGHLQKKMRKGRRKTTPGTKH